MALVNYSDSDSDECEKSTARELSHDADLILKRKRVEDDPDSASDQKDTLPPLPAAFHDLYATNVRVSIRDDPDLHGGRKRVTPHVEGNWPTHVYLEWYPNQTQSRHLLALISQVNEPNVSDKTRLHTLLHSDLGAQLPLHVSLSRPVVLVTDQRQPFQDAFERSVQISNIRPFDMTVTGLDWVSNFERTRWFLVLRLSKPNHDGLNRLLRLSNETLAAFGQRPLYADGVLDRNMSHRSRGRGQTRGGWKDVSNGLSSRHDERMTKEQPADCSSHFHISIAWRLDEPSVEEKEKAESVDLKEIRDLGIKFHSVKLKIGNVVNSSPLPTDTIDEKGFGGL